MYGGKAILMINADRLDALKIFKPVEDVASETQRAVRVE
jgi:hypothetical protein